MATISIQTNTVRPFVNHRSDDTAFGAGTFSWQDAVHSWKAGPGEVMTVENKQTNILSYILLQCAGIVFLAIILVRKAIL